MKEIELSGKKILNYFFRFLFRRKKNTRVERDNFGKILVLRLDQRVGNGILLLPLLSAIRDSLPNVELHLVLHYPVAELIRRFSPGLVDQFWEYHQAAFFRNPFYFLQWLLRLRKERFDLIISSHNPNNFSLSQALLGRWAKPEVLIGFRWKDSPDYYDLAIPSSTEKHYSEAHLDLWRAIYPEAEFRRGELRVPESLIEDSFARWGLERPEKSALFWLGATGDKVLPEEVILLVYEQISQHTDFDLQLALGPADRFIYQRLPVQLREQTLIWENALTETAIFFSGFRFFISGDTGPMHLAVALGIPNVSIFNQENYHQYGYDDGKLHFAVRYSGTRKDLVLIQETIKTLCRNILYAD